MRRVHFEGGPHSGTLGAIPAGSLIIHPAPDARGRYEISYGFDGWPRYDAAGVVIFRYRRGR